MSGDYQSNTTELGWCNNILKHFTKEIAGDVRLTVVYDPDQLLNEHEIMHELRIRGFELMLFEDHVAFRFEYESRYRRLWNRGEKKNLVVILRNRSFDVNMLPYDLIEQAKREARCFSFSIADLFPKLSSNVLLALDRSCLKTLYLAIETDMPNLGENATKDFILRHVFEIAPEFIKSLSGLFKVLLKLHYRKILLPKCLSERFIFLVKQNNGWQDESMDQIITDRSVFFKFLNEHWALYIQSVAKVKSDISSDSDFPCGFTHPRSFEIPFGHDDIKIYIDKMFQEGLLVPVKDFSVHNLPEEWMRVGVQGNNQENKMVRFKRLLLRLEREIPNNNASHLDWVSYAQTWGEWTALRWLIGDTEPNLKRQSSELHDKIETRFTAWMQLKYSSLYNLASYQRPAMLHHIAPHLAHHFKKNKGESLNSTKLKKLALVVIDGLAMDQWVCLRNVIMEKLGSDIHIKEDGVFAWVPTLTSVSRQSIFSGKLPILFANSLRTTSKEPVHWKNFWTDHGAKKIEVSYIKEGKDQIDEDFLKKVIEVAEHPKRRVLGVVVNKIDQSMHGIKGGTSSLHAVVRDWARNGNIGALINHLLDLDYEITLTSDHGNIHGIGMGKPNAGAIADERGERAHVFNDELTRAMFAKEFPGSIEWPQIALPDDWRVLLAPGRKAFIPEGKQTVGHGGIAMEEVIVPFIKLKRSQV